MSLCHNASCYGLFLVIVIERKFWTNIASLFILNNFWNALLLPLKNPVTTGAVCVDQQANHRCSATTVYCAKSHFNWFSVDKNWTLFLINEEKTWTLFCSNLRAKISISHLYLQPICFDFFSCSLPHLTNPYFDVSITLWIDPDMSNISLRKMYPRSLSGKYSVSNEVMCIIVYTMAILHGTS